MATEDLRKTTLDAIASDEQWISRATAVMQSCDGDVSSMEQSIAAVRRDVERMRALV